METEIAKQQKRPGFFKRAYRLYADGFRTMSRTSRTLWVIILVKLFVMFAILKVFFFPNIVGQQGDKAQQADFVMEQLTEREQ